MHPASRSIQVFGIYVVLTGLGLTFAPALLFSPLGVPVPAEVWVRVLGVLAIVVGYYYWACGRADAVPFFVASVRGRLVFAALCVVLVVAYAAPLQLLLFCLVDIAGAAWTYHGLRAARAMPAVGATV
jgi:hypothetical protein